MIAPRTLGEFVEQEGVLAALAGGTTMIIERATEQAKRIGKRQKLPVVQCFHCNATKTCCHSLVIARLYEGVVVAAHLRAAGRDTPELRAELAQRAVAMEAADPYEFRVPCVFLGERERCTVYPARPSACGTLYVYTPPAACSDPTATIDAYLAHEENAAAGVLEEQFREKLGLRKKVGRRYLGVLPRMVLVALDAWDRTDFRDYLRGLPWPSEADSARWARREHT